MRRRGSGGLVVLLGMLATGCDDHVILAGVAVTGEGFCGVVQVFDQSCLVGCHDAATAAGGLDLDSAPYAALTAGPSPVHDVDYVVPGDASASFLYQKVAGTQGSLGSRMPIGSALSGDAVDAVGDWIDDGAADCGEAP